jgi:predicted cytidylate kinase
MRDRAKTTRAEYRFQMERDRNKISITGSLGSGKSTVARALASRLSWKLVSTGALQRQIAGEMGLSTLELNSIAETRAEIDHRFDAATAELGSSNDAIVFDSRLAWHFVPHSFKVRLEVGPESAARRVYQDLSRAQELYGDLAAARESLRERALSEATRFSRLYGINLNDRSNFDLVIRTDEVAPEQIVDAIMSCWNNWCTQPTNFRFMVSPRIIFPTRNAQHFSELRGIRPQQISEAAASSCKTPPNLVELDDMFYIYDGHDCIAANLMDRRPLMSANVFTEGSRLPSGETARDFVLSSVTKAEINNWEVTFRFVFNSYPRCL